MTYAPQACEPDFLLFDVLRADRTLQGCDRFADMDRDVMRQVLQAAATWVGEVVAPLSRSGDEAGCTWADGQVTTPAGFKAAYQAFCADGWPSLSCDPAHGGQGLPKVLESVVYEWLWGANHAWTMSPGLLHGAYECLRAHASAPLQAQFLPQLASGESLATMCLTEPHAGSDLGLVRTQATPEGEHAWGTLYRISGSKIFITGGEHDWTDNILHLVLARLPHAPAGPKGLSLFLVPKRWDDGTGATCLNGVVCDRIEEKMGLHGSPTCSLHFEGARGWLIGAEHAGLQAMFVMMNAARLNVALQGIGLLDAAWQKAHAYALERRQMRVAGTPPASRGPHDAADLLVEHPALRRILDEQRAWIDGGRLLAYQTALQLDLADSAASAGERAAAQQWCAFITPVLKAVWTQQAFDGASQCLQVLGGHGYVREWGIEQIVRDARVSMIYEGTNEIQAIDLLTRKILPDQGQAFFQWLLSLRSHLDAGKALDADVLHQLAELRYFTLLLVQGCQQDAQLALRTADDFLRAVAVVLMGWAWARIASHTPADDPRWQGPCKLLQTRILPEFAWRLQLMKLQWQHASLASPLAASAPA